MAKIKNNFLKATINKDSDERLIPDGQMTDAENVLVMSQDNGNAGVLKNVKGNLKVTSLNIPNSETIGSIADDANDRCFYFVTSPTYDYVIQFNLLNNTSEILLQSTNGTGVLNFDSQYRISHSDLFISVEGDDLLSWTDGINPPRIINIERAKTYGIDGFTEDEVSVMKPSPIFSPNVAQVLSDNSDFASFLRDKFLSFAYRYRYEDGYYSSFSSWSPYAFYPGTFDVDLDTSTNIAMENIAKSYQISFNTGPREVKEVELVFKLSNNNNVYSIIKLNKDDEGWSDSSNQSYLFENYKVYNVLSENEFFRSFDNVPLSAYAQARIGNRLVYGNFLEGRDIDSKIDFTVDYESAPINTLEIEEVSSYENASALPALLDIWGSVDATIMNELVMNYTTNIATITNTHPTDLRRLRLVVETQKEATFSSVPFTLKMYIDGVPTSFSVGSNQINETRSWTNNITGGFNLNAGQSAQVYFEVESDSPLLLRPIITYRLVSAIGSTTSQKAFNSDDYYQLFSNDDNVINKKSLDIDLTNIPTTNGTQLLFEFDIRSYFSPNDLLPPEDNPNLYTFSYTVNGDYITKEDFIDDSNFISQLNAFFTTQLGLSDSNLPGAVGVVVDPLITSFNATTDVLTLIIPNRTIDIEETGSGDLEEKIDYVFCEGVSVTYSKGTLFTSMHSARDYEVGMVFLDDKGRKTTVIDAKSNSVYVESVDSVNQNVLKVTTIGTPPSWAKYYKFAVKYNRGRYETIFTKKIYNVDLFAYLELVGDNKNKVKDGAYLVVKSDINGPLPEYVKVKVLDARFYEKDEITTGSTSGFYFKIKPGAFDLTIADDDLLEYIGKYGKYLNPYYIETAVVELPLGTPLEFKAGNIVTFAGSCDRPFGSRQFRNRINQEYLLTRDYPDFRAVFEDIIEPSNAYQAFAVEGDTKMDYVWLPTLGRTQMAFKARTSRDGKRNIYQQMNIYVTRSSIPVFETIPIDTENDLYVETPKTYVINNGQYQFTTHTLNDVFNCYCFGNSVESISVRDEMTTSFLNIDYGVNAVSEDVYRQVNRYADLTYSGVYQESTNVNRLNEFNLSLANYKDDLDKRGGEIIRLDSDQTDLLVIQEDKWSKVLYGKDVLYNTDATTNLSRIEEVLGQQVMYSGEYGISYHPDSYDDYGTNSFCTDTKRGIVLRYNESNGLTEISNSGLRDYFKILFRDNEIVNIMGQYDAFFDIYFLNIKYKIAGKNYISLPVKHDYVTWIYSPEVEGFLGRQTFDPDSMLRIRNEFLTFKGADVYKHNVGAYNNFYNTSYPVSFEFNFSQEPSARKIFKTISIEGNSSWNVSLKTDLQNGYINQGDFVNKEGVQYGYIRGNDTLDLKTIAVTGLGTIDTITGTNIYLKEVSSTVSVGDLVYNSSLTLIGTILYIDSNYIVLNSVTGLSVGDFILSSKPSSIETSGLRGYYMNTRFSLQPTSYVEVYSVNSEASHSFE